MTKDIMLLVNADIEQLQENPITCVGCRAKHWTNSDPCEFMIGKEVCQKIILLKILELWEEDDVIIDP